GLVVDGTQVWCAVSHVMLSDAQSWLELQVALSMQWPASQKQPVWQLCVAEHGIGMQMFRLSQVQPAPQLPSEAQGKLITQSFERGSQKPFAQSLSLLQLGAPEPPLTQVERESQIWPVGHVPFWQKLVFLQAPFSQSQPGAQSQSERHCPPFEPTLLQPELSQE